MSTCYHVQEVLTAHAGYFDPKIRASIMCSSGFVYLHYFTKIRTFLRKESTVSLGSCFMVQSLYLASLKLLLGATYSSNFAQYVPMQVSSSRGLLASTWRIVLGLHCLTKSAEN